MVGTQKAILINSIDENGPSGATYCITHTRVLEKAGSIAACTQATLSPRLKGYSASLRCQAVAAE